MTDQPESPPPFSGAPEAPDLQPPVPESRRMRITGIHHATLICADLARTTAFYRDVLGLALVRETSNDDDPGARHFWFAADASDPPAPGSIISFLEYPDMGAGTQGTGSTHHIALAVGSAAEVAAWRDYLHSHDVPATEVFDRGNLTSVYLRDPDGHILEIVAPSGS